MLCHQLKGQGSTVGPPLDGIGTRKDAAYLLESLVEPNKRLADGYQQLGVSPMPPMGLILKPQELKHSRFSPNAEIIAALATPQRMCFRGRMKFLQSLSLALTLMSTSLFAA